MKHQKKQGITVVVQIPAYNEEKHIGLVIKEIPRNMPGVKEVKVVVIDDGSTDNTIKEAKKAGADVVLKNTQNRGLAQTFGRGMIECVRLGADIIVNTDADFQYNGEEIPKLLAPILNQQADIVTGNRQVEQLNHMIPAKKYGNIIGSKVVKLCAGNDVIDASSGFRAYSREAALRLFITSNHTYTHQSLIQATHKNLVVAEVPVEFRKREGRSKLIKSVGNHVKKSVSTIMRTTLMYHSLKFFSYLGIILVIIGLVPIVRWFYLSYIMHEMGQHLQSLILGSLIITFGGFSILLGFISDILAINRKYLEEILYLTRRLEIQSKW